MNAPRNTRNRRGTTAVEMAVVVSIFLMLLFGILEWCRFIYVRQIVVNAGREGARFAVVNTTDSNLVTDTQAIVQTKMGTLPSQTSFYQCQVYQADNSGNNIGAPTAAQFGQYIAVQVDYDYSPLLPQFLFMGKTFRITTKSMMFSEAN